MHCSPAPPVPGGELYDLQWSANVTQRQIDVLVRLGRVICGQYRQIR